MFGLTETTEIEVELFGILIRGAIANKVSIWSQWDELITQHESIYPTRKPTRVEGPRVVWLPAVIFPDAIMRMRVD